MGILTERQRAIIAIGCFGLALLALLPLAHWYPDYAMLALGLVGMGGLFLSWRTMPRTAWMRRVGARDAQGESMAAVGKDKPGKLAPQKDEDQFFNDTFGSICLPMALIDADGRISAANSLFHSNNLGAAGESLLEQLIESDRKLMAVRLGDAAGWDRPSQDALHLRFQRDSNRIWRVCSTPFGMAGPKARRLMVFMDATEQQHLHTQFVQNQKMQAIGQLAGGVAHDFNNLLTAMIGHCDLILSRARPTDPNFGDLMQIKQNANRAADLVRQLLAFSRRQTLQPRLVNLADVVDGVRHLLSRLLGPTISFDIEHGRDLGLVRADAGQIEQVIVNLSVNARDAMPSGGRLRIATQPISAAEAQAAGYGVLPPGDYAMLTVADTGQGIPPENLSKIFEPFFTTKEKGAGTGLGLATVYGVVQQTDGHIFVESEVGKGTAFRIFLPQVMVVEATQSSAVELVNDTTGQGRILLVEDETAVREFARRALESKGYDVAAAASGEEALEIVQAGQRPFDILVTDVIMPGIKGGELAIELRRRYPGLKLLFISGYADEDFRSQLGQMQDAAFLPKPFSLATLAEAVKNALASPNTQG